MLYECHVTMLGDTDYIEEVVKKTGWHFSKIDGDPVLGAGVKCYATQNFLIRDVPLSECVRRMEKVALDMEQAHVDVVRIKVEEIVYDRRL